MNLEVGQSRMGMECRIFPIASHVLYTNELRYFLACFHCFYILLILLFCVKAHEVFKMLLVHKHILSLHRSTLPPFLGGFLVLILDYWLYIILLTFSLFSLLVSVFSFLTLDALVQACHEQLYVVISDFDLFALLSSKPFLFVCCAHRKLHWQGLPWSGLRDRFHSGSRPTTSHFQCLWAAVWQRVRP